MIHPIDHRVIPATELKLNKNEVFARLQVSRAAEIELDYNCVSELEKSIICKYSAVRVPVLFDCNDGVNCGFGWLKSKNLSQNLMGCCEAFVFAVTLGIGVDRFLNKMSLVSPADHFISDAFASAYAESAADVSEQIIKGRLKCRPRFSPGYGDLDLSCQQALLDLVNARNLLGISLGKSLLMTPIKTITAIVGIENE